MGPPNDQQLADLHAAPGEFSFEARIGGESRRIWFRTQTPVTPPPEAALAACLMPAMRLGGSLTIDRPLSPTLLRCQREYAALQRAWSLDWTVGDEPLRELELRAPSREPQAGREPTGRVAAFFSGGVDSFAALLDEPAITDLIFVRGFDILPSAPHQAGVADRVEERLREAAAELGKPLHLVDTNIRELSDGLVPWEAYYPSVLAAVALLHEPLFDRVLISTSTDYGSQPAIGASRLAVRLWRTEQLAVEDACGRLGRAERIAMIASDPIVRRTLRVCWENRDGAYNCGRCRKCLMTMVVLEALGSRQAVSTFPPELDLGAVAAIVPPHPLSVRFWEGVLDVTRRHHRDELERAVEQVVERGRSKFGPRRRPVPTAAPEPSRPATHRVTDLHAAPGELSFEARIGGEAKRVWIRTETAVTPSADAALAACLMPAMRDGGTLTISDPVSPRLLRNQREFAAIQRTWSQSWHLDDPPLRRVEVTAPERRVEPRAPTGRVASFFSGGVDSWAAVIDNPDLTDLIFVRGIDLLPDLPHQAGLADQVESRLCDAAAELGLRLHVVETNLRELADPLVPWEAYAACPLAAIALFFEPLFDRVLIAGETDYETQEALDYGAIWTVDQLWSTERLEIVDWGGHLSREQRQKLLLDNPVARRTLRVCWENPDGAYNCGRCRKCMLAKVSLEALGVREQFTSFPPGLDLDLFAGFELTQAIQLVLWEDAAEAARAAGRADLAEPIEAMLARGRRNLGLPPSHRSRRSAKIEPAPPSVAVVPTLLATEATAAALSEAGAVAILVGSYDGSGNFGDIAQLDAALRMLEPLEPDLLVVSVVELGAADSHHEPAGAPLRRAEHVLYFDPEGRGGEGLEAAAIPAGLPFAACYLYGGGYLNPNWGSRKLAMLAATEALLSGAARVVRVASGLQVDPDWLAVQELADRRALSSFEPLGGRDPSSATALATLADGAGPFESGDDAVGAIPPRGEAGPDPEGPLRINLHFAEHPWVTDGPEEMLSFHAGLLAELGALGERELRVQPLLAYLDPRTDERPGLERLRAACAERGVALEGPILLRPGSIDAAVATLAAARLTLSCSYHVALTSLLLEVPAILVADNPYYEKKAAGLADTFGLPPALAARSDEDPAAVAKRVASAVLEADAGAALRAKLAGSAASLRGTRARAEAAILSRLAAGALSAVAAGDQTDRSSLLASEQRAAATSRAEAEAHRQLAALLGSRSWRLAEPLRQVGAALRARRRRSAPRP